AGGVPRLARDRGQEYARVLGVHVQPPCRQRLVDDLRGADVVLERDLVSLRPQRLRVERAEDVLLGEVLVADRHRRLADPGPARRWSWCARGARARGFAAAA